MLGPLPHLYRIALVVAAVTVFLAVGAWVAQFTPIPLLASVGAGVGAAAGLVAAYLLVHDFSHQGHRSTARHTPRRR
ncbi:hypothetical protein [Nocardioides pacificus]